MDVGCGREEEGRVERGEVGIDGAVWAEDGEAGFGNAWRRWRAQEVEG